ncbi:MAG TPA: carboxylating nicotinate-nucleotide diphosphorylase [Saprospiraceae bacterium]|nr:carboxylating nicotinate-nucleotide diphosphorylase [Saprospiraceae bacterium]
MSNTAHVDELTRFIVQSLQEDVGDGDHTSLACIPPDKRNAAQLLAKDTGIVAGVRFAQQVFKYVDPVSGFDILIPDGDQISPGDIVFKVQCNSQALLKAERLVLNVMQRMSAISTQSRRFADEVSDLKVKILDTRKTTPLMRFLEKEAVAIGGCTNYRFGLYDRIMIKDNHIDACGGITQAIDRVHAYLQEHNLQLKITIEVRNLIELYEVLRKGQVDRIMLDNFEVPILREAVDIIGERFETEASGGISLLNVRQFAETGVDFISVGALTHSYGSLDLSLKVARKGL